jgi:hypothetical protein
MTYSTPTRSELLLLIENHIQEGFFPHLRSIYTPDELTLSHAGFSATTPRNLNVGASRDVERPALISRVELALEETDGAGRRGRGVVRIVCKVWQLGVARFGGHPATAEVIARRVAHELQSYVSTVPMCTFQPQEVLTIRDSVLGNVSQWVFQASGSAYWTAEALSIILDEETGLPVIDEDTGIPIYAES